MIALRPIDEADVAIIKNWPAYPPEFAELDYALREGGWLDEHLDKSDAKLYVAEQEGGIIAFTLLAKTIPAEAEFRIALRADMIGLGIGKTLAEMTLQKGFSEMRLDRIHLIVRKNNPRAVQLYRRLGFAEHGECVREVNGKQVDFIEMYLNRN